jgi:hypothetical protein
MPDFDLAIGYGLSVTDWLDPRVVDGGGAPTGSPSRLNPRTGYPEKRYVANVDVECELRAVVDGVEAPLDGSLDGRLFWPGNLEYPVRPMHFSSPAGQTSKVRFIPRHAGHYALYVRRPAGGQVMIHLDAVEGD